MEQTLAIQKPLTGAMRSDGEPLDLKAYEASGGYQALRKVLRTMKPAELTQVVKDANLKGRGGGGFSAGRKWSLMPSVEAGPHPRYVAINGDEMEPGSFKDRLLLERNPHMVIEGTILAGYALDADSGIIFLRWAFKKAMRALERALAECYEAGYLGSNILGTDFGMHIHTHESAGRYMAGEAAGMLNAIEGKRAVPRYRPPHMTNMGLWGRPTVVNNVETIANVPHIALNGAEWFRSLSRIDEGGTKIYGVSGRVKSPGLWELPMGTTLRELLEEHAGGMRDGFKFRAALPGGASSAFFGEEYLDVPLGWAPVEKVGKRFGTGTVVVMDDHNCPVGTVLSLQRFFARESCGWCTPCREGLPWIVRILVGLERGEGTKEDLDLLRWHTRHITSDRTFCELAPGAMESLSSALEMFGEDFERHVSMHRCPWT